MANFINKISKIKITKIAKENSVDYSNAIKGTAKKEDNEKVEKEVKKKIFSILLYENLSSKEKDAVRELKETLKEVKTSEGIFYTIDEKDIINIYSIISLFESE